MSAQLKTFCSRYLEDYDMREACREVGLPMTHAARIMQDPFVSAYLEELQVHFTQDSLISRRFVELQWLEQYAKASGGMAVPFVNRDGEEFDVRKFDGPAANAALKELGKIAKVYPDGHGGGGGVTVNIDLGKLTGDMTNLVGQDDIVGEAIHVQTTFEIEED